MFYLRNSLCVEISGLTIWVQAEGTIMAIGGVECEIEEPTVVSIRTIRPRLPLSQGMDAST